MNLNTILIEDEIEPSSVVNQMLLPHEDTVNTSYYIHNKIPEGYSMNQAREFI